MSSILKSSLRLLFEESNVCMCEGGREKETSKDRERKTHTQRERERMVWKESGSGCWEPS